MSDDQLFPSAAPDFSDPLGLLRACHQRILSHCATLQRLVAHLREQGADAEARKAAGTIYRYFTTAGRHHHDDEEIDLFPHLARQSLKLADRVHRLRQDHLRLDALWGELEPLLKNPQSALERDDLEVLVGEFTALYADHIQRENDELLEMAAHIFSRAELQKLGKRMADRRERRG